MDLQSKLQQALEGRYLVECQVGQGGMGLVFRAQDLRHDRPVAIKVMRPELAEVLDSSRFVREIMTAAQMAHPGILPVHDSGSHDGLMYFVMPFVDGGSLRSLLDRETQLPLDQALRFATELGEALAYAHQHGVVHRDLKPENVLLEGGRPVIADFGVALAIGDHNDQDGSYSVAVGTPHYMSPEQATPPGRTGRRIDGRADLYALACVLYEMLAGSPPITGPSVDAILARKLMGEMPGLRTVRPTVPRTVERAIARALSPIPADRFESVDDFLDAIRVRRPRWPAVVAAAGVTAIAAVAGASVLGSVAANRVDPDLIVVDEFADGTGDPALAALGFSAADWITTGLHGTRLVGVVPTYSAVQAGRYVREEVASGRAADPLGLLAAETGAGIVVSGAYYRDADQLTLQAQVSVAAPTLWQRVTGRGLRVRLAHAFEPVVVSRDSMREGIAQVGSRVMGWLASSRGETPFAAPAMEHMPPTYSTYERFAAGMRAYVVDDRQEARAAFLDAYARDTTFVVALLYAALNTANLGQYAAADSMLAIVARSADRLTPYDRLWVEYRQALLSQNRPAALRAVRALDAEAPGTKATYNLAVEAWENGHLEEALDALQRLTPDVGAVRDFIHYWGALANLHLLLGHYDEALDAARRAQRVYPEMMFPVGWELAALAALGRTTEVTTRAADLVHADPDPPPSRWTPAQAMVEGAEELQARGYTAAATTLWEHALEWYRRHAAGHGLEGREPLGHVLTLYALGRYDETADAVAALLHAVPDTSPMYVFVLGLHGRVAARLGDSATAGAVRDRLVAMGEEPYTFGRPLYQAALIAAVRGDDGQALALLRRARAQGLPYGHWLRREGDLEPVRHTRAFQMLAQPVAAS